MKSWSALSERDRRAVLLGGLVLGSAIGFRLLVKPYVQRRAALLERLHEQEGLLQRELALVHSAASVIEEVTTATGALERMRPWLLDARDPLGAAAALVGEVGDDARRHGVLVEAIEGRPPEPLGGDLTAVQVDVRGRGDLQGLLFWLNGMENGARLLRIEQLSLARVDAGAATDSLDTETLTFALSIRGFTMGRGGSPSPRVVVTTMGVAP